MSSSIQLVLPISAAEFDTILLYLTSNSSWSHFLAIFGMSATGIDLETLGVSGSNCKLVVPGT